MRTALTLLVALSAASAHATTFAASRGVYQLRPDPRDCAWPWCGGVFIRAANHSLTTCHDGTVQDWCYVVDVDWMAMGIGPTEQQAFWTAVGTGPLAVYGDVETVDVPGFGDFGYLVPVAAAVPAGP